MEGCFIGLCSHSFLMSLCSQFCGFFSESLITFSPELPPYFDCEYYENILICLFLNMKLFLNDLLYFWLTIYQWIINEKEWTRLMNQDSKNMTSWKVLELFYRFYYSKKNGYCTFKLFILVIFIHSNYQVYWTMRN